MVGFKMSLFVVAAAAVALGTASAKADGTGACNIADVMFGKVRVELIAHREAGGFETGIIFGDDFDSKRFPYGNILGQILSPERDGSRHITDTRQNVCGVLNADDTIDTSEANCTSCDKKAKVRLKRVTDQSYAVLSNGSILGTLNGRLPK